MNKLDLCLSTCFYSLMAQLSQPNSNHHSKLICLLIHLLSFQKRSKQGSLLFPLVCRPLSVSQWVILTRTILQDKIWRHSFSRACEGFFFGLFCFVFPPQYTLPVLFLAHSSPATFFNIERMQMSSSDIYKQMQKNKQNLLFPLFLISNWDTEDFYPVLAVNGK